MSSVHNPEFDNTYTASYFVRDGDTDRAFIGDAPISIVLSKYGTPCEPYTGPVTVTGVGSASIDAHAPASFLVNTPTSAGNGVNGDGKSAVTITWTDSESADVDHYEIVANAGGQPFDSDVVTSCGNISPGSMTATFSWVEGDNLYVGVVAVDGNGNRTECVSEVCAVTVASDTASISSLSPADGDENVSVFSNLHICFSKDVHAVAGGQIHISGPRVFLDAESPLSFDAADMTRLSLNSTEMIYDPEPDSGMNFVCGVTYTVTIDDGAFEDDDGKPADVSGSWSFTTQPVYVTGVSANKDMYETGDTIRVIVSFSDPVTVNGTPQLSLFMGETERQANYVSGNGFKNLTFEYTVQDGDFSLGLDYTGTDAISLNGGSIENAADGATLSVDLTLPEPGSEGSLSGNADHIVIN